MSHEFLLVRPPPAVREPRATEAAAMAAVLLQRGWQALARAGAATWRALEAEGRRRADQALRSRGSSLEALRALGNPALEAAQVRELAALHERTDPGFAADLRAAAYRHEALHEATHPATR